MRSTDTSRITRGQLCARKSESNSKLNKCFFVFLFCPFSPKFQYDSRLAINGFGYYFASYLLQIAWQRVSLHFSKMINKISKLLTKMKKPISDLEIRSICARRPEIDPGSEFT